MSVVSPPEWENFLTQHPEAHILQSRPWGDLKTEFGWQVLRVVYGTCGAQLLFRRLLPGLKMAYLPKGPVGLNQADKQTRQGFWQEIHKLCQERGCFLLKVEPDLWCTRQAVEDGQSPPKTQPVQPPPGFHNGFHSVQPPRTLVIDLHGDEQDLLGRMKQKTRYNINLALKKGVVVRPSSNLTVFHRLMQETGQRDQFGVHSLTYYQRAYELFHPRAACELFLAEYEGQPLGGLMVFSNGTHAWYLYGASSSQHRDRMPNYLLQWEAMRWARNQGCIEYDLWGVPDVDFATLEANFTRRSQGLWGVYRFKRGFGGELRRAAGPWDHAYHPWLYKIYSWWMQRGQRE